MLEREINLLAPALVAIRTQRIYLERLGHLLRFTIFAGVLVLAALAGSYVVVWRTRDSLSANRRSTADYHQSAVADVQRANAQLGAIADWVKANPPWTPLVADIFTTMPAEVTVRELSVKTEANALEIRGTAGKREALLAWQKQLEKLPWVELVKAPLSNFETAADSEFSLEVVRKAEK